MFCACIFDCVQLSGKRHEVENGVLDHINCLCSFMEDCLRDWRQHIGDQRTKLYYLNHFTTEQLVILQAELAKVGDDHKNVLSTNVYSLLSKVKKNCCLKDLQKAMHLAFSEVTDVVMDEHDLEPELAAAATDDQTDDADDQMSDDGDSKRDVEMATVQEFIQKMEDLNFSEKLAWRALKEVGAENVDDGNTCRCITVLLC